MLRDRSGRYQVLDEIDRGGVGVVYEGRDTDLGRDVAMRVLKEEYAVRAAPLDDAESDRVQRDARRRIERPLSPRPPARAR